MKYFLIIIIFFSIYTNTLNAQKQIEGIAVRIIDNRKDIYHYKNEFHRKVLIKEATLDAIEKGADISIKNIASYNVENVSIHNYEQSFEDYVSKTLQEYHVIWRRSSQFEFSRDKNHMKKWTCKVRGVVIRKEFDNSGIEDAVTSTINGNHNSDTSFYVVRKSLGKVHINAGYKDGVIIGSKFIVNKYINKKSIVGHKTIKKTKAQILITDVGDDYAIGNIISGYFRQLESNKVNKGNFRLNRGGFKYEVFMQENIHKITKSGINNNVANTDENLSVFGHGLSFYHWGYHSKWGFEIGMDIVKLKGRNYSESNVNLKIGGYRNFTILTGLFYLQPKVNIGIIVFESDKQVTLNHEFVNTAYPMSIEGKLGGILTLNFLELSAGLSYKYFNSIDELSNFYPYFGIGANLYR